MSRFTSSADSDDAPDGNLAQELPDHGVNTDDEKDYGDSEDE